MPNENSFKETEFQYCSQINQYYQLQGKLRIPVNKRDVIQILKNQFGVKGTQVTDFLQDIQEITLEDAISLAKAYLNQGMSVSMAAKQAAKETGIKKGEIYKALQEEE